MTFWGGADARPEREEAPLEAPPYDVTISHARFTELGLVSALLVQGFYGDTSLWFAPLALRELNRLQVRSRRIACPRAQDLPGLFLGDKLTVPVPCPVLSEQFSF